MDKVYTSISINPLYKNSDFGEFEIKRVFEFDIKDGQDPLEGDCKNGAIAVNEFTSWLFENRRMTREFYHEISSKPGTEEKVIFLKRNKESLLSIKAVEMIASQESDYFPEMPLINKDKEIADNPEGKTLYSEIVLSMPFFQDVSLVHCLNTFSYSYSVIAIEEMKDKILENSTGYFKKSQIEFKKNGYEFYTKNDEFVFELFVNCNFNYEYKFDIENIRVFSGSRRHVHPNRWRR